MKCRLLLLSILLVGCATGVDRWTGSVDAVFRYRSKDNSTVIFKVRPESASAAANLTAGDVLLAVDGVDITGSSYQEIREALRGPVGTWAVLTVRRGSETVEIEVERKPIRRDSIKTSTE